MRMSLWNRQILLEWDGTIPSECSFNLSQIYEEPDLLRAFWPVAGPYMKYSKKLSKFIMSLSAQNLRRIHREFGQIPVVNGYQKITMLKEDLALFNQCKQLSTEIKNGRLEDISYKMKPLGHYQHVGVNLLTNSKKVALFADCGCLSGDTEIQIGLIGLLPLVEPLHRIYALQEAYKDNGIEDLTPTLWVRSFTGDGISSHRAIKVVQQGIKKVLRISLADGKQLKATHDHEIMTRNGWKPVGKLTAADKIMVDNKPTFNGAEPDYSNVRSIVAAGEEMTYDIVCEDPHRNFSANGIIVHNCGKTFMVLASTQEQINRGTLQRGKTLICGKLATLETGWVDDCAKFTNLKPALLWVKAGAKRKEKMREILNSDADIFIINHEGLKTMEEDLIAKQFHKVVLDESTILKNYFGDGNFSGGKLGKCLMRVAAHAEWRVVMSGTPAPNTYQDLWGQIHFLDPNGFSLEASIGNFRTSFMEQIFFGNPNMKGTPSVWKPLVDPSVVYSLIEPITYRVRIRDHLHDLPEKTIIERKVQMGEAQRKHYVEMEKELYTEINEHEVSVALALTRIGKLRQITSGFLIDAEETPHPIEENPKLAELDSLINDEIDPEHKIVIYCQFRWEIETLAERYKDHGVGTVYGGNGDKNLENIRSFINDPKMRICILHPKSAAHGVTFTCAHYMIFYSISYSAEDNYQCVARIERAGQRHPMFVYYLLAQDSIDELIYKVLGLKQLSQEELLDKDKEQTLFDQWKSNAADNKTQKKCRPNSRES